MFRLLVAGKDSARIAWICGLLRQKGYGAIACADGGTACDILSRADVDLIVSDMVMPSVEGFALIGAVQDVRADIPMLFLSGQGVSREGIGDDTVRAIDPEELLRRVEEMLCRTVRHQTVGSLMLDAEKRAVYRKGERIPLTEREFCLLRRLLSAPAKTFSRAQLMEASGQPDTVSDPRTVDAHVAKLRAKLAECDEIEIVTVHGKGYMAVIS